MTDNGTGGTLVKVSGVDKVFKRGSEVIHVLGGLDLEIPDGEFLALMGPSGSGKSTLLNLIGGLDRPSEGTVVVGGKRIDKLSKRKLAAWRARSSRIRHYCFAMSLPGTSIAMPVTKFLTCCRPRP